MEVAAPEGPGGRIQEVEYRTHTQMDEKEQVTHPKLKDGELKEELKDGT